MKNQKIELDVDFIGGAGHLTRAEEKVISEFIKASKLRKAKLQIQKRRPITQKRAVA